MKQHGPKKYGQNKRKKRGKINGDKKRNRKMRKVNKTQSQKSENGWGKP
jgi:hypothetical protein